MMEGSIRDIYCIDHANTSLLASRKVLNNLFSLSDKFYLILVLHSGLSGLKQMQMASLFALDFEVLSSWG